MSTKRQGTSLTQPGARKKRGLDPTMPTGRHGIIARGDSEDGKQVVCVFNIDQDTTPKRFCETHDISYTRGCCHYEVLDKKENVSAAKRLIALDTKTNTLITNTNTVRSTLQLGEGKISVSRKTFDSSAYRLFVQSTSVNRKLPADCALAIQSDSDSFPAESRADSMPDSMPGSTSTPAMAQQLVARGDSEDGKQVVCVFNIDQDTTPKRFCETHDIPYTRGCCHYEVLDKKENVSAAKRLIALDTKTNTLITNTNTVRSTLQLGEGKISVSRKTFDSSAYRLFVQSTSVNRKLPADCALAIQSDSDSFPSNSAQIDSSSNRQLTSVEVDDSKYSLPELQWRPMASAFPALNLIVTAPAGAPAIENNWAFNVPEAVLRMAFSSFLTRAELSRCMIVCRSWAVAARREQLSLCKKYVEQERAKFAPQELGPDNYFDRVDRICSESKWVTKDTVISRLFPYFRNSSSAPKQEGTHYVSSRMPQYPGIRLFVDIDNPQRCPDSDGEETLFHEDYMGRDLDQALPLGITKIGGLPQRFPGMDLRSEHKFVAQVRCDELASLDIRCQLPTHGMLYFFGNQTVTDLTPHNAVQWYGGAESNLCRVTQAQIDAKERPCLRVIVPDGVGYARHEICPTNHYGTAAEMIAPIEDDLDMLYAPDEQEVDATGNEADWAQLFMVGGDLYHWDAWQISFFLKWSDYSAGHWDRALMLSLED
jgi:hypothetical protein